MIDNDLLIEYSNTDSILVKNYTNSLNKIENIELFDETVINISSVMGSVIDKDITFNAQNISLNEDTIVSNSILLEGNTEELTYEVIENSSNGEFILNINGSYTYTPNLNYYGIDSIIITVTNKYGNSATSTLTFQVDEVNDAPIVLDMNEEVNLNQEISKIGKILANDIEGDLLSYSILEETSHGKLSITELGEWKYLVDTTYTGNDFARILVKDSKGAETIKILNFNINNNLITGTVNNETLYGMSGDDIINGLVGDDFLDAREGDDILTGGKGNDTLLGRSGNDTYIFNIGDGIDKISESGNIDDIDKIVFGEGITKDSLIVRREGNYNLLIEYSATDKITIQNWFSGASYQIERFEFADGTALVPSDLLKYDSKVTGTIANETLYGMNGNDVITGNGGTQDNLYGGDGDDTLTTSEGNDTLYGENGNDILTSGAGNDYLDGGDGNDTLTSLEGNNNLIGGNGNDILTSGEGNDKLTGGYGDDVLTGGTGNDTLNGSYGSDTYIFKLGDGVDTLSEYSTTTTDKDKIVFGEGIIKDSINIKRDRNNLVIEYSATDKITIENWLSGANYKVETFEFSDGTSLNITEIESFNSEVIGTIANETLYGMNGNDVIIGNGGTQDNLFGRDGDDTLTTSEGNDYLYGENGNDILNSGAGNDYLDGGEGDDTLTSLEGNNNLIGGNGNDILTSGEGNDKLTGGYGDDVLTGGTGNDTLNGSYGSDTYIFKLGDGVDTLSEYSTTTTTDKDKIVLGEGITKDSLIVRREGNYNLVIEYSATDKITIQNWFSYANYKVETFEFSDGTSLNITEIESFNSLVVGTIANEALYGMNGNDVIIGNGGTQDNLYGGEGDDTLTTSEGNDYLYGENGNDILNGESGNDNLSGGNEDDVLTGGAGNDYLSGDYGSDTYVFNLGDGVDTIYDYDSTGKDVDKIVFGEGITKDSISFNYSGNYLKLSYSNDDLVSIYNQKNSNYAIEKVELSDGSYLSNGDIENIIQQMSAYAQNNGIDMTNTQDVRNNENLMAIVHNSWNVA
jgi:Ca2+-binding RTX toxin-like protein